MDKAAILVVEDEAVIARAIQKQLRSLGYTVAGSASKGEEAVRLATELRPDLILMDIHLGPGIDGIETSARIRRELDVPVVYLTAHSDDATLMRAKVTEPHGYVLKPYEDIDLQIAIEVGLHKHDTERRLRENEQWLAAILSSIGDGLIATDDQGRVRFMNRLAERLTGWSQSEAIGKSVADVFPIVESISRQPVTNPVLEALATGDNVTLPKNTILTSRTGDEYDIDDSAAPIRDHCGQMTGAVLVFRDITERRRLEERLQQAQKLEAIGRLAGGIAHDFNNIMTIIIGTGELLLSGSVDPSDNSELLRQIVHAGERAAKLTKQILAFSRKQMLLTRVLNLNTVVQDMALLLKRHVGSNVELVIETAEDLGQVRADPTQIGQVILNLAANAQDAFSECRSGRLVITTANAELDASTTRKYPDVNPGKYALLSVSDTGCGMSAEVLQHIFEPFFTTKDVGQGTGLGLAMAYGIVKQSGGHIEVESQVGKGTTVRVYLPLIDVQPTPSAATPKAISKGHETILIVDDEKALRNLAKIVLKQSGYDVLEASDGNEAIRIAESHEGRIHLLLTDVVMPDMSGLILAQRLTSLRPGLRVLLMSGYADDILVGRSKGVDNAGFLQKPFSLTSMTSKVREILDKNES